METHPTHLALTLETLRQNSLFPKFSKCKFGFLGVEYLGHIVSTQGVSADPSKIQETVDWPFPKTLKALEVS
jgi:hypothetical protein